MTDTYNTVSAPSEGIFKDKGSRFLAFLYPVKNEEEIRELLQKIKKEHYNARHHCYAWRLGKEEIRFRANDDGEPSSTAGKPILGQLLSHDLSDVLLVVVRYFGGIKLGTGGLVNAYRTAAGNALEHASVIEKRVLETMLLQYNYDQTDKIMKAVHDTQALVVSQSFMEGPLPCRLTVRVPPSGKQTLLSSLEPT